MNARQKLAKAPAVNIGISEADRAKIAKGLSKFLADSFHAFSEVTKVKVMRTASSSDIDTVPYRATVRGTDD